MSYIILFLLLVCCNCEIQASVTDSALIPLDSNVVIGKLDNGLTYYIRQNKWPEKRACFYLVQRVGSMQEEENQRGLAHFLEHMCFNGSTHFPGNSMDSFSQRIGLSRGAMNAYTSYDETMYYMDDVPTDIGQDRLDSCLLVLYDWANGLTLDSVEIEKERGVIHEEWRDGRDAATRINDRQLPILFPDCKYGVRQPIGLMEVVDHFNHHELKDYYEKWYNPQTQCVVVVGDIDVSLTERKIKEIFSGIKASEKAGHVVLEEVKDHKGIIYSIDKDKELQNNHVFILWKHRTSTLEERKRIDFLRNSFIIGAADKMLDVRFGDLALEDTCSFLSATADDEDYFMSNTKENFGLYAAVKTGRQTNAITELLKECRRAATNGFTQGEYDRYLKDKIMSYDNLLQKADREESSNLAVECCYHYLYARPLVSVREYVAIMKEIATHTTLDDINQAMRKMLPSGNDNMVLGCWSIEKDSVEYPTKEELYQALMDGRNAEVSPYVDPMKDSKLLPVEPVSGSIVKEEYNKDLDYTKLTLSNGVKVLLKHTHIEDTQVLFRGYGKGGWTLYGQEDDSNVIMLSSVPFGVNGLTYSQCEKLFAGKWVDLDYNISQREFSFTGSAQPQDLGGLMEFLHAHFTCISKDEKGFNKAMENKRVYLQNEKTVADNAFTDSVSVTADGHHPRFRLLTEERLKEVSLDRMQEIIEEQTACPANYTFVFVGNYDKETIRPQIEKYLASLPQRKKVERGPYIRAWIQNDAYCHFEREMETPKTTAFLQWSTDEIPYSFENTLKSNMARRILDMVYEKTIREEHSATYDCSANYFVMRSGDDECLTGFSAECSMKPELCDTVLTLMKTCFMQLAENIDESHLRSARESMLKSFEEDVKTSNGFWTGVIWQKENRGIDTYTNRRKIIEGLTTDDIKSYVGEIIKKSYYMEVLMEPKK